MASGLYLGDEAIGMVRVGVFSSGGTDTSDATASSDNIENGKTAYVDGKKVIGTLSTTSRVCYAPTVGNDSTVSEVKYTNALGDTYKRIQIKATSTTVPTSKSIIDPNSIELFLDAEPSSFGDATAADVTSGKTFTSSAGLKVVGTRTNSSTETGTDTSDATAEASDIVSGKTAYVASGKVTGTLNTPTILRASPSAITEATIYPTTGVGSSYKEVTMKASSILTISGKCAIDADNTDIRITAKATEFGDATAADVAEGKTFTSAAGLKVKGTKAASGGLDTSDATAAASDILSGKTAYVNGAKVTGTISKKTSATFTPGTSDQIISSGQYLAGPQTIKGDTNLVAGNIKSGVSIFGVTGTLESGSTGLDTSDATATSAYILSGKTAYVNGKKITGTMASKTATIYTPSTSNQTIESGQYLSGVQTIKGDSNLVAENIKSGVSIFGVEGTYSGNSSSSSDNCEAYVITGTSDVINIKNSSGNLKVWGYGKTTGSGTWGGSTTSLLSFCGDKYYKSVTYGQPTYTSLSLSVSSSGTISGLPSMTECNLLVTVGI